MLKIYFFISFFICVQSCVQSCVQNCADHFWRDYDGSIPPDAIPAGYNNKTNCQTYIGQVYVHNDGLFVGTINPGSMEIIFACQGVKKRKAIIKILCAPDPSRYAWKPTTAATYREDMEGEMPVLGGYHQRYKEDAGLLGTLNIGRVLEDERAIIGIIAAFFPAEIWLYYPLKGKEIQASHYEALVYRGVLRKKIDL